MTDRLGLAGCFAGLNPCQVARCDAASGEIRIPLTVYSIEGRMGDIECVLSTAEAESHHAWLARVLAAARRSEQEAPAGSGARR